MMLLEARSTSMMVAPAGRLVVALLLIALFVFSSASQAATVWVSPEPRGEEGPTRFEFALPADMERFENAKVVLVSSDPVRISYGASLVGGTMLVDGQATLFESSIRELDVSPLMLELVAGEYAGVVFETVGAIPNVLALRLEYREAVAEATISRVAEAGSAAPRRANDAESLEAEIEASRTGSAETEPVGSAALVTNPTFSVDGDSLFATNVQIDGGLEVLGPVTLMQDGAASGLDADLLDGQEGAAFAQAAHGHDGSYFTEAELSTSGGGGAVHWDNLTSKPATFPDDDAWIGTGDVYTTTGRVGVGIQVPGAQLHVSRNSGALTPMFHVTGNSGITGLYVDSFNRVGIRTTDMDREFNLDGTMVIDSSVGSNGILWQTPSTALINGIIVSGSDQMMGIGRNQPLRIEDLAPGSSLHIRANGNVGIGKSDPSTALDVVGDATVSGYTKLALTAGAPPATDCDEASERGRMKVDNAAGLLYACADSGWVAK